MYVIHQIRRIRLLGLVMCLAAGVFLTSATASQPASGANAVTTWNANASDATIAACFLRPVAPEDARSDRCVAGIGVPGGDRVRSRRRDRKSVV